MPTVALLGFILWVVFLQLAVLLEGADRLVGPGWGDPTRRWAGTGVLAALAAFHVAVGRRAMAGWATRGRAGVVSITPAQAALVVGVVVGTAAFGTYLLCKRD